MEQASHFLARIVRVKRAELPALQLRVPQSELEAELKGKRSGGGRSFREALLASGPSDCAIIAECKKASPSCGVLCQNYDPAVIARRYREAGARALSVLTEREFFLGSLEDLKAAKAASSLPVLRKDFVLSEYQIYEAAVAKADALLLIVAILEPAELARLVRLARELALDALVEVHTANELQIALDAGADTIGVNNRDLKTFQVSLETSLRLIDFIPDSVVAISESGLRTAEDLERLRTAGFDAFLIGERFMTAPDPGAALEQLLSQVAQLQTEKSEARSQK